MHPFYYLPEINRYHIIHSVGGLLWLSIFISKPVLALGGLAAILTLFFTVYTLVMAMQRETKVMEPSIGDPVKVESKPVVVPLEVTKPGKTQPSKDVQRRLKRINRNKQEIEPLQPGQSFDPSEIEINF